jgi:phosphate/sulfate permease
MCWAGLTGAGITMGVCSTTVQASAAYVGTLHSHYTTAVHLYEMALNLAGRSTFRTWRLKHTANYIVGPSFQCPCHCVSTDPLNSICLTDWLLHQVLTCYPNCKCLLTKCYLTQSYIKTINQKRLGNLTWWTCIITLNLHCLHTHCFGHVTATSSNDITENGTLEENRDVKNKKPVESVEARRIYVLFSFLQTMTATFASFVHGGNDVRYAASWPCKKLLRVDTQNCAFDHWGFHLSCNIPCFSILSLMEYDAT